MPNETDKLKCASFFSGVGGIDLGFEQTGHFDTVYANEWDIYPVKTFEANFPLQVDNRDIKEVKPEDVPDFDVLLAGFPCTDISIAGNRQGLRNDDGTPTRSGMFFELEKFIKDKQPQVILLENVKNLLTHNNGETLEIVLKTLENNGYTVKYKVMNACEYGNVPQNRERIYIVAFKDAELGEKFVFPEKITLDKSLADIIDFKGEKDEKYYYHPGKYKGDICEIMENEITSQDTVYQWRRHYVRKNKSGVVPTLTANMGGGGHNVPLILSDNGVRKLTPKECFNAQGFPEEFILPDDVSESRLYKQAGNSVCVPVIKRIAENIAKVIFE